MIATALALAAVLQSPAPAPVASPAGPQVALETSLGRIVLSLEAQKAPVSVKNFLSYVRKGHYDGTIFHRVIPNFMVQGGGFDPNMKQRPTAAAIVNEAKNGLRNNRGTVAMARTADPNSATAQFFINVKDNHRLDYGIGGAGYAVFASVAEGMDVVDRIVAVDTTSRPPHDDVPVTPVLIKSARVVGEKAPARPAPGAKP
jgi:cyclophilin family peptidyl-prolyl cis-trans isomerase